MDNLVSPKISLKNRDIFDDFRTCIGATDKYSISLDASICLVFKYMRRLFVVFLVPKIWTIQWKQGCAEAKLPNPNPCCEKDSAVGFESVQSMQKNGGNFIRSVVPAAEFLNSCDGISQGT